MDTTADRRHDWEEAIEDDLCKIASELVRGRIGFLFGSGMSIPGGGISGPQLAEELIVRGHFPRARRADDQHMEQVSEAANRYPLEAIASGVATELTFQDEGLRQLLKHVTFGGKDPETHDGHTQLATIVNRLGSLSMLFTTNWDGLLEQALGASAETISKDRQITTLDEVLSEKTAVVHLHGTFEDEPLLKEADLMNPDGPLFQLFLSELMSKSFVFVGYSLSDPEIRALYYKAANVLASRDKKLRKRTYVVFPCRNDVDRRISTRTWDARNATYIPLGADEFFKRLVQELETQAMHEVKDDLAKRLGVERAALEKKVDELMALFPDLATRDRVLMYLHSVTQGPRQVRQ